MCVGVCGAPACSGAAAGRADPRRLGGHAGAGAGAGTGVGGSSARALLAGPEELSQPVACCAGLLLLRGRRAGSADQDLLPLPAPQTAEKGAVELLQYPCQSTGQNRFTMEDAKAA